MPKLLAKEEFEMQTRDRFTKVDCEISIVVNGKELPSLGVVGEAVEKCIALVTTHVAESYAVVPERV